MKHTIIKKYAGILAMLTALTSVPAMDAANESLIDGFESETKTTRESMRLLINDAEIGGNSSASLQYENGVLKAEGKIVPARGQPGFVSLVLFLSPDMAAQDVSEYEGIRLKVRVTSGNLQVIAASTDITNYDYHAAPIRRSEEFKEIRIKFSDMKRAWSEQVPLNEETIASVNLVMPSMQPATFSYEIDEIGFY